MILKAFKFAISLFVLAFCTTAFLVGRHIPFAEQWPLYEALRTTAAIIFAVVGAWLAIIYPERLKLSFKITDESSKSKVANGVGKLLSPAINSTAILSVVLLVGISVPILKRIDYLMPYRDVCRGFSYALVAALTFWQLWTIILTLIPADVIKSSSDQNDRHDQTVADYKKLGSSQ
jgi:hypothetical protein